LQVSINISDLKLVGVLLFTFLVTTLTIGQSDKTDQELVQLSGVVVTEEGKEAKVLPYTNVAVKGTSRGTITETDGFFSLVALKGETVVFSRIGYKNENYIIPDTLTASSISIVQSLTKDTVLLAEAVIYPWPSKENFKEDFLAMNVDNEAQMKADKNLKSITMKELMANYPKDNSEAKTIMLRESANNLHNLGLARGFTLFNFMALKKLFSRYRSGGFKKKKEEKNAFDIFLRDKETHGIFIIKDTIQKSN